MTTRSLNDRMEFDCPVYVNPDGTVSDSDTSYVPSVEHSSEHDMLIDGIPYKDHTEWEAVTVGYTEQYGYHGPVMHASEFIGGGLERDILATPGVYVAVVVEVNPDDDDDDDDAGDPEPAGWTVLRAR